LVHEVTVTLGKTFVTPIDIGDIHKITNILDDVIDYINATAIRIKVFKITQATTPAINLCQLIKQAAEETKEGLIFLQNPRKAACNISTFVRKVRKIEHQGDVIHRQELGDIFERLSNPVEIIKWLQIYERLEAAIDKCEDLALLIESVVLKHA